MGIAYTNRRTVKRNSPRVSAAKSLPLWGRWHGAAVTDEVVLLAKYGANRRSRLTSSVSLRLTASRLRARSRFGSESPLGFHSLPNRASRPRGEALAPKAFPSGEGGAVRRRMRSFSLRNHGANRHSRLTSSVSLRLTASHLRARSRFGSESPLGFHSLPNRASRPGGEALARRCVFSSGAVFRLPASPVAADCRRYGETRCRCPKTGFSAYTTNMAALKAAAAVLYRIFISFLSFRFTPRIHTP